MNKLRRSESFMFDVEIGDGSGRRSFWMHPAVPIQFHFFGSRQPRINPHVDRGADAVRERSERSHDRAGAGGRVPRRVMLSGGGQSCSSDAGQRRATVSLSISRCSTSTLPRTTPSALDDAVAVDVDLGTGPVSKCSATSMMPPDEFAELASSSIQLTAQLRRLRVVEDESQRDRRVQPERAAPSRLVVRMPPRDGEALVASELGRDDDLEVRECAVLDVDRRGRSAVVDGSHARTLTRRRMGNGLAPDLPGWSAASPARVSAWACSRLSVSSSSAPCSQRPGRRSRSTRQLSATGSLDVDGVEAERVVQGGHEGHGIRIVGCGRERPPPRRSGG